MDENYIRIYMADCSALRDSAIFTTIYNRMPKWRQKRADSIKNQAAAVQSLGAGYLLDYALGDIDRRDLLDHVVIKDNGKPSFDTDELYFNLSHSGNMAMCVISNAPVGCDIQNSTCKRMDIADRFFAEDEISYIHSAISREDANNRFFEIWTRKEAFLKLTGEGIARDMRGFSVLSPDLQVRFRDKMIGDYSMSVCTYCDVNSYYFAECDIS